VFVFSFLFSCRSLETKKFHEKFSRMRRFETDLMKALEREDRHLFSASGRTAAETRYALKGSLQIEFCGRPQPFVSRRRARQFCRCGIEACFASSKKPWRGTKKAILQIGLLSNTIRGLKTVRSSVRTTGVFICELR
jgi:hypothetical protein